MDSEPKTPDEIEVDRLLGDLALVKLNALQPMGGPSEQMLYRAEREGLIEFVRNGRNNALTRATAKQILLKGLGPIAFRYGQQGEARQAKQIPGVAAREALAIKQAKSWKRA